MGKNNGGTIVILRREDAGHGRDLDLRQADVARHVPTDQPGSFVGFGLPAKQRDTILDLLRDQRVPHSVVQV